VYARLEVAPIGNLFLVSDRADAGRPDQVLGMSPSAGVLAALTVRRRVGTALDVGCGSGIQAIIAGRHAVRVTATDLNPRALRFVALNVALNDCPEIELLAGNLYGPVGSRTFDLVMCNPPFIISPESAFLYRDGGLPADGMSERVARGLGARLNEGGFGHALVSWIHGLDEDWTARVRAWTADAECDVLLVRYTVHDAASYARACTASLSPDPEEQAAAAGRWLAYYQRLGIEAVSWGALILRKRRGPNWFLTFERPADRLQPMGDAILALFDSHQAWS
jgi:methylase of polypeptide subunit release factors